METPVDNFCLFISQVGIEDAKIYQVIKNISKTKNLSGKSSAFCPCFRSSIYVCYGTNQG